MWDASQKEWMKLSCSTEKRLTELEFKFSEQQNGLTRKELVELIHNLFDMLHSINRLGDQENTLTTTLYHDRCRRLEYENEQLVKIVDRLNKECQELAERSVEVSN